MYCSDSGDGLAGWGTGSGSPAFGSPLAPSLTPWEPAALDPAGGAPAAPATTFVGDWPEGEDGWTVELKTLPKEGTIPDAVSAAKTDVTGQGAPDVGALDSDLYPSLDPGAYVIYSGIFDSRKQAARAARKLKKDFPDARAVEVSGSSAGGTRSGASGSGTADDDAPAKEQSKSELKKKESLSPEEYQQEQKKKQPTKLKSQGAPPKKDKKKPGGGSGATEIG